MGSRGLNLCERHSKLSLSHGRPKHTHTPTKSGTPEHVAAGHLSLQTTALLNDDFRRQLGAFSFGVLRARLNDSDRLSFVRVRLHTYRARVDSAAQELSQARATTRLVLFLVEWRAHDSGAILTRMVENS